MFRDQTTETMEEEADREAGRVQVVALSIVLSNGAGVPKSLCSVRYTPGRPSRSCKWSTWNEASLDPPAATPSKAAAAPFRYTQGVDFVELHQEFCGSHHKPGSQMDQNQERPAELQTAGPPQPSGSHRF